VNRKDHGLGGVSLIGVIKVEGTPRDALRCDRRMRQPGEMCQSNPHQDAGTAEKKIGAILRVASIFYTNFLSNIEFWTDENSKGENLVAAGFSLRLHRRDACATKNIPRPQALHLNTLPFRSN
jgi:hypothetical protein